MEIALLNYFLERLSVAALKKTNGVIQGLQDMSGNAVPVPTIQKAQDGTVTFYDTQGLPIPSLAGSAGPAGPAGPSAYDVAVTNGYSGTQAQWLASLTGSQGPEGPAGAAGAAPSNIATLLASKIGGDGGVFGWGGTVSTGYFQLCSLANFPTGTLIDFDAMMDYTASAGAKNISLAVGATNTSLTTLATASRTGTGDAGMRVGMRIARISDTELYVPKALDAGLGAASAQQVVTPPTINSALWLVVTLPNGTDNFKLSSFSATLYPSV